MWTVTVDAGRCAGSGMCASLAARHFRYTGGLSTPPDGPVVPDDELLAAAECCPMEAIVIRDQGSGRVLHP